MFAYLVHTTRALLPAAMLAGVLHARWRGPERDAPTGTCISVGLLGVVAGLAVFAAAGQPGSAAETRAVFGAFCLLFALLGLPALALNPAGRRRAMRWPALLLLAAAAASGAHELAVFSAEKSLSAASILNVELIGNVGGMAAGLLLAALAGSVVASMGARMGKLAALGVATVITLLLAVAWAATVPLEAMGAGWVELSSGQLSLAARVQRYDAFFTYVEVGLLALLTAALFVHRRRFDTQAAGQMSAVERRVARVGPRKDRRWLGLSFGAVVLLLTALLYQDLCASRPPSVSEALRVRANPQQQVIVPLTEVRDGDLHRYSYVTSDGRLVRFFLIALPRSEKIAAALDACMLCARTNYRREGNNIICTACDTAIFVPTIGRKGGCNPIPLPYETRDGAVVIAGGRLEQARRYFSETVTATVFDAVTGATMTNREAPFRSRHDGRMYYFESERTRAQFEQAPAKYRCSACHGSGTEASR